MRNILVYVRYINYFLNKIQYIKQKQLPKFGFYMKYIGKKYFANV